MTDCCTALSTLECRLLSEIQRDFPLTPDPYAALAAHLDCTREEAHAALLRLRRRGIIRRIGGCCAAAPLGYASALAAARVDPAALEAAAACAGAFTEVTHNYQRAGYYNLWFTIIARPAPRMMDILAAVRGCAGVQAVHLLPGLRQFKLQVCFHFAADASASPPVLSPEPIAGTIPLQSLDTLDRALLELTCGDIGDDPFPYARLAETLYTSEEEVLRRLAHFHIRGIHRRFGAVLHHRRAGYIANGLSVWDVPEEQVEQVGMLMAGFAEVSHCYERPRLPDWPYNLYAMVHAMSQEECDAAVRRIAEATGQQTYEVLYSLREFKKTSMQYRLV